MEKLTIKLKRVYEKPEESDGFRVLVDRLWPRGVSKERAQLDIWLKDVAPSTVLRQWFAHDPKKWAEFTKRYRHELVKNPALDDLWDVAKKHKTITLLFAAKDEKHNEAVVLKNLIS